MKNLKLLRALVLTILSLTLFNCSVEDGINGTNGIDGDNVIIDQFSSFGNVTANVNIFEKSSTSTSFSKDLDMNLSLGNFSSIMQFDEDEQLFTAKLERSNNVARDNNISFEFEISQDFSTFTLTSFSINSIVFIDNVNFFIINGSLDTFIGPGLSVDDINITNPVYDSVTSNLTFDYSFTREASIFTGFIDVQDQQINVQGSANVILLIEKGGDNNTILF